ncbi:heme A synthase [uncultured Corynebacterium sp.]|uniref:COX15/CtaA family protein n=1 Tax=uncultured Corynebacterium sp. TaxID=159447 RepID=UPI0025F8305D|nr:COX15/CtaA family protein [uncultured Corynebacterium sp.]
MSTANISSPPSSVQATRGQVGPSVKMQRILALILLLCQGGITVSGSIVRVTGSGLGCVTWPNCHPGSLVPLKGAAPLVHQVIEFGNRLLTFVVAAAAVATIVAMHKAKRRKELKVYAWLGLFGIVVQALIGALSVILKLSWWSVAIHFLPSMVLVWIAALLYSHIAEPDEGRPTRLFPAAIRTLAVVAAIALSLVLLTGTFVTGSGTHSGDAGVGMEGRLGVDTYGMAVIHAICMYVYLALTLVVVFLLHRSDAPKAAKKAGWVLIVCILVQWAIGVLQFYLHIPRWTVPFHVGMSSVVTAFTALLWAHGQRRILKEEQPSTSVQ